MNRQEFLAVVEATWRRFDTAIEGLDEAALVEPGVVESWSIKDLLGHVTAWEQMALRHVDQWRRGETSLGLGGAPVDDYNATEAARRRDWSLAQVRQEAAETRRRLRDTVEALTDDEWNAIAGAGEQAGPLGDWIAGALGGDDGPGTHALEHARHILAWRNARGATDGT